PATTQSGCGSRSVFGNTPRAVAAAPKNNFQAAAPCQCRRRSSNPVEQPSPANHANRATARASLAHSVNLKMHRRMLTTLLICLGLLAITSPADEMHAAVADVERLPPEIRPQARYLTLYSIPEAQRADSAKVVSYVLNALSRTRAISSPVQITP